MPLLGREPGTQVFRDLAENPADETFPGIAVLRLDGGLFFATAEALEDRVRELTPGRPITARVVLDLEGVNFVDSQGADEARRDPRPRRGGRRRACGSRGSSRRCRAVLEADGVLDRLGADHIHGNVHGAVEAELATVDQRQRRG